MKSDLQLFYIILIIDNKKNCRLEICTDFMNIFVGTITMMKHVLRDATYDHIRAKDSVGVKGISMCGKT